MSTNNKPRLVIIISDGPMIVGTTEQIANRQAIHIPINFPHIPNNLKCIIIIPLEMMDVLSLLH